MAETNKGVHTCCFLIIFIGNFNMMKKLAAAFFFILFSSTVIAQRYIPAEIEMNDGAIRTGNAQVVLETKKKIRVRATESGVGDPIPFTEIKRVTYFFVDDTITYARLNYYAAIKSKKLLTDGWFELIQPGYVSIYLVHVSLGGGTSMNALGQMQTTPAANFKDYYAYRIGDLGARPISTVASFNSNATFKMYAPIYFSDYPELAEKIKNKEYTYKDLLEVTNIYNDWIAANKKP